MDERTRFTEYLNDILYSSGDAFLPNHIRTYLQRYWVGDNHSLYYITNWTFVHFWSGFVLAIIMKFIFHSSNIYLITFQIHMLWELWQIIIGMTPWTTLRGIVDIANDTLFYMAGVWLGLHISRRIYDLLRSMLMVVIPP